MDRYQFEGYISDYIENALSIAKRKEFEQFMADNPEAKEQVNAVRNTILSLNHLPQVKTSAEFMDKLQSRVTQQRDVVQVEQVSRKPLIFGFTPLTATMMSLVVLAIVFVGYELMPTGATSPMAIPTQVTTNNILPNPVHTAPITNVNAESVVADAQEDSSFMNDELPQNSPDFEDRINYVKTQ
jgi:anti-sigma factor RsiW